jgi:hypothetical protein
MCTAMISYNMYGMVAHHRKTLFVVSDFALFNQTANVKDAYATVRTLVITLAVKWHERFTDSVGMLDRLLLPARWQRFVDSR